MSNYINTTTHSHGIHPQRLRPFSRSTACQKRFFLCFHSFFTMIKQLTAEHRLSAVRTALFLLHPFLRMKRSSRYLYILLQILSIKNSAVEDKKEQLQRTYGILMEKEIDQEVMDMCNFSDFIEQRGIEKGLEQGLKKGLLQGKAEGKVEATLLHVKKTDAKYQRQCGRCYEYAGC